MAYTFSLPSITALSRGQRIALNAIVDDVFIISGCPGSGKTTVSLLRAKGKGSDQNFHFTVWANLLYGYLLNLSNQLEVDEEHFSTFFSWFWRNYKVSGFNKDGVAVTNIVSELKKGNVLYHEFQLDEGQDLPTQVRCALSFVTKKLVICMDPAQDVLGECNLDIDEIEKTKRLLESYGKQISTFRLSTNWRNTKPIFEFSREIIPELNSQINVTSFAKEKGVKPILYELNGNKIILKKIIEIIKNEPGRNIGIMDDSLHNLHLIDDGLKSAGIETTLYDSYEHRKRSPQEKKKFLRSMSKVILSTFISCKGLEFNTVIIANISILSDTFNKKKGYYVGCTRAQDKLILFKDSSSYDLPNWFQQIDNSLYKKYTSAVKSEPF